MKNMLITATIVGAAIAGIILYATNCETALPGMHAEKKKLKKKQAKRLVM